MANHVFLSTELMRNSKCSKCNNYLSVPPIVITSLSKNPICGRCVKSDELVEENRAYFYENLAAFMFFPCVNDIYGCSNKTSWEKVLYHEANCRYQRIICPIVDCNIEIGSEELIPHCKVNHEKYILSENHYPLSNTENSCQINKLLIWKNRPFIIQTKSEHEDFFLRISSNQEAGSLNFKCILHGKKASYPVYLNEFKIVCYTSKFPDFTVKEKIDVGAWKKILGPEIQCTLNFDFERKENNYTIVSALVCPECKNYMKPPISVCSVGHSFCQECRKKLSVCPSCSNDFGATRNYCLEKISDIATRHCRYPRCKYQANLKNMVLHELKCLNFKEIELSCVLRDICSCNWKGSVSEAFQHTSLLHPDHCFALGQCLSLDLSTLTKNKWVLLYDDRVFILCIRQVRNADSKDFLWAIFYIGNSILQVGDKYILYFDIVKDNRVFRINQVCQQISENLCPQHTLHYLSFLYKLRVTLPISLINDFINQDKITFALNIVKSSQI